MLFTVYCGVTPALRSKRAAVFIDRIQNYKLKSCIVQTAPLRQGKSFRHCIKVSRSFSLKYGVLNILNL